MRPTLLHFRSPKEKTPEYYNTSVIYSYIYIILLRSLEKELPLISDQFLKIRCEHFHYNRDSNNIMIGQEKQAVSWGLEHIMKMILTNNSITNLVLSFMYATNIEDNFNY